MDVVNRETRGVKGTRRGMWLQVTRSGSPMHKENRENRPPKIGTFLNF